MLFWRFGAPPYGGVSWNYRDDTPEKGVSVFPLWEYIGNTPMWENAYQGNLPDRDIYVCEGVPVGIGSDGEPVIEIHDWYKADSDLALRIYRKARYNAD